MFIALSIPNRSNVSIIVTLDLGTQLIPILCHMGDLGCGDGGWTPVIKINGNKVLTCLTFV